MKRLSAAPSEKLCFEGGDRRESAKPMRQHPRSGYGKETFGILQPHYIYLPFLLSSTFGRFEHILPTHNPEAIIGPLICYGQNVQSDEAG